MRRAAQAAAALAAASTRTACARSAWPTLPDSGAAAAACLSWKWHDVRHAIVVDPAAGTRGLADDAATLAPCERQPEQQVANEIDQQLAEAAQSGGAEAVVAVVEREGERFTELNVVTALQQLAAAVAGGGGGSSQQSPEEIVRTTAFQMLVDMVLAGMMRFEPRLLAEAVRSCGKLGASEEMLLDEIGRHIMGVTDELSAADVAALVEGFAALDHSPGIILFETLADRAAEVRDSFTPEQRSTVQSAYEQLGYASKAPPLG